MFSDLCVDCGRRTDTIDARRQVFRCRQCDNQHPHHHHGVTRDHNRELWLAHVSLTREFIQAAVARNQSEVKRLGDALDANQAQLGEAMGHYRGEGEVRRITVLLQEHIHVAGALVVAARDGDQAGVASNKERWYANANEVADAIGEQSPGGWFTNVPLRALMATHLDDTLAEALQLLKGEEAQEVYEKIRHHILLMGDVITAMLLCEKMG